jgi:hypothetical protein
MQMVWQRKRRISRNMKKEEPSIKLLRHQLGSIDISDIIEDEKEMSKEERAQYCAAIFAIFPRLEKDIKRFLHRQLMFISNRAVNWEQVIFGRGTFNGIDLLYKYWKDAAAEFEAKPKEERKKLDKHKVMPEI